MVGTGWWARSCREGHRCLIIHRTGVRRDVRSTVQGVWSTDRGVQSIVRGVRGTVKGARSIVRGGRSIDRGAAPIPTEWRSPNRLAQERTIEGAFHRSWAIHGHGGSESATPYFSARDFVSPQSGKEGAASGKSAGCAWGNGRYDPSCLISAPTADA